MHQDRLALRRMRWVLFATFLGLFITISGATIWTVFFSGDGLDAEDRSLLIRVFLGEVGLAVVALFYAIFNLRRDSGNQGAAEILEPGASNVSSLVVETYPRSQHPRFFSEVETMISDARRVTLIGIAPN
jgi:hypothetical protein